MKIKGFHSSLLKKIEMYQFIPQESLKPKLFCTYNKFNTHS